MLDQPHPTIFTSSKLVEGICITCCWFLDFWLDVINFRLCWWWIQSISDILPGSHFQLLWILCHTDTTVLRSVAIVSSRNHGPFIRILELVIFHSKLSNYRSLPPLVGAWYVWYKLNYSWYTPHLCLSSWRLILSQGGVPQIIPIFSAF